MRAWYQRYPSVVIAILLAVILGGWYGKSAYEDAQIAKQPLLPIAPSKITFLGLPAQSRYRIVITNGQPYILQRGENDAFAAPEAGVAGGDSGEKKRVPADELLKAMTGDGKALGELLLALGDRFISEDQETRTYLLKRPVTYKVLDKPQTVEAEVNLRIPLTDLPPKEPDARKKWEDAQFNHLPIESVTRLLENCEVVLTEQHITRVSSSGVEAPPPKSGQLYTLHFDLNEQGRRRLLQETSKHLGEQIVILADGIPVAAPIIRDKLSVWRADIPNVDSEDLVLQLKETAKAAGIKTD